VTYVTLAGALWGGSGTITFMRDVVYGDDRSFQHRLVASDALLHDGQLSRR
jgi:hypothetical protein